MKIRRVLLGFLLLVVFLTIPGCQPRRGFSASVSPEELRQKVDTARKLVEQKKAQGEDVSEVLGLYREAKAARAAGNLAKVNTLLDRILVILRTNNGSGRQKAPSEEATKMVRLNVQLKKAYCVRLNPKYEKGNEIIREEEAFETTPLNIKDGMADIVLGSQPVFIVEDAGIILPRTQPEEDSPFGFHPAKAANVKGDPYGYARDIGVSWHRPVRYFFWPLVQADIKRKAYDWADYDNEIKQAPDIFLLYNISVSPPLGPQAIQRAERLGIDLAKYAVKESHLPANEKAYTDFVTACVERYDGDGKNDMPGLTKPIKYWQIGNEPEKNLRDFAGLVKITSTAIKKADPEAKVVMGGARIAEMDDWGVFENNSLKILKELDGKYIDVVDFHWGGDARGNYRKVKDIYGKLREQLNRIGFRSDIPVWITEMSTYSGDPVKLSYQSWDPPFQTEKMQASDLIKRYVFSLSAGIKKIFWAFGIMEGFKGNDSYFDHTGLVYDGKFSSDEGFGVKKLGYYAYQLMTGILGNSDWDNIQTVKDGKDNIYAYKFPRKGSNSPVYVVWWDYFDESSTR